MSIYTVIGYKESGYDTRHQEYYRSELDCIHIFDDVEGAANQIARYKISNKEQDSWLPDWEWQILVNGRDWDYWRIDFWDDISEDYIEEDPFDIVHLRAAEIFAEWESKAKEREQAAKQAELEKQRRSEAATAAAQTRHEKALLKTLKEKYPNE